MRRRDVLKLLAGAAALAYVPSSWVLRDTPRAFSSVGADVEFSTIQAWESSIVTDFSENKLMDYMLVAKCTPMDQRTRSWSEHARDAGVLVLV